MTPIDEMIRLLNERHPCVADDCGEMLVLITEAQADEIITVLEFAQVQESRLDTENAEGL